MDIDDVSWCVPGLLERFLRIPKYFDPLDPYWQEQLKHPFGYELLDDHPTYDQPSDFDLL